MIPNVRIGVKLGIFEQVSASLFKFINEISMKVFLRVQKEIYLRRIYT